MTIIDQEGHGKLGRIGFSFIHIHIFLDFRKGALQQQSTEEGGGIGGGHERGSTTKQFEKLEADRFPALGLRGADVQVRNGTEAGKTPSMGDPQSKDGELVIVTEEECAEERLEGVEALRGCSLQIPLAISWIALALLITHLPLYSLFVRHHDASRL